jgi:hypothetical protein
MSGIRRKCRNIYLPALSMALVGFYSPSFAQTRSVSDPITRIPPDSYLNIRNNISVFPKDSRKKLNSELIPSVYLLKDRNSLFFDSLKVRASRNLFTKRLYDFVVTTPDTARKKLITSTSDAGYLAHSGKKIRNIEIQQLNVFGADINKPSASDPNKIEKILNKSHINTNENIIRKNLLFTEGDLISPLTLSDNERILRQLPYIDDARIIVVPVSDDEADIVVLTKDVYSLGASYSYHGLKKGSLSVFERNIFGMGHEFGVDIPYDSKLPDSPGFGIHYMIDNIGKTFLNLNTYYRYGLGEKTYGFSLNRKLVSSATKYAGGISIQQMSTTEDLDTLYVPEPLKYNLQDYWLSRSFLVDKESVSRIILGIRYTNNNVFDRPVILPESYYCLQNYRMYLGSAALSVQKYYKTNLIYGYGRTEDIPYGGLLRVTAGREFNEFKQRTYLGTEVAVGKSNRVLGYLYASAGFATYLNKGHTEQGLLSVKMNYFSNLSRMGKYKIRNFVYVDYTRGFDRYTDESLIFINDNGFSGFRNDSVCGAQRFSVSVESVVFSPVNLYGFRFAFFGFADFSILSGTNQILENGYSLSSIGLGIRIRNDNLLFNTFQIRLGFYPNLPADSKISHLTYSGEQLLRPNNFDPGPPSIIPYR